MSRAPYVLVTLIAVVLTAVITLNFARKSNLCDEEYTRAFHEHYAIFSYKCSAYYNQASEGSLLWNDETLNIDWGTQNPILSEKDKVAPKFL